MTDSLHEKELRILRMMKKVLTDIAKDTYTPPSMKHPLSANSIQGIRDCLGMITAREQEIGAASGQTSTSRPYFTDEPQTTAVVSLDSLKKSAKKDNGA